MGDQHYSKPLTDYEELKSPAQMFSLNLVKKYFLNPQALFHT